VVSFLSVSAFVLGPAAQRVRADVVYTYTGNSFNDFLNGGTCPPTCNVTGSFTVAEPLGPNLSLTLITPLSFTITSGTATLTDGDPDNTFLSVGTDASGVIDTWSWEVVGPESSPDARILTQNVLRGVYDDVRFGSQPPPFVGPLAAEVQDDPGTWSSSVVVPEPGTGLLLSAGLIGGSLIFRRRRR
jgi:PEP-CTERM motif